MRVGKRVTFRDIKVGEVFAVDGCWNIFYKDTKETAILLADDYSGYFFTAPGTKSSFPFSLEWLVYTLPKSVQSLWIEW